MLIETQLLQGKIQSLHEFSDEKVVNGQEDKQVLLYKYPELQDVHKNGVNAQVLQVFEQFIQEFEEFDTYPAWQSLLH